MAKLRLKSTKAVTWTYPLMHLHGVNVFNLHEVILCLCQDHGLNQYTKWVQFT